MALGVGGFSAICRRLMQKRSRDISDEAGEGKASGALVVLVDYAFGWTRLMDIPVT